MAKQARLHQHTNVGAPAPAPLLPLAELGDYRLDRLGAVCGRVIGPREEETGPWLEVVRVGEGSDVDQRVGGLAELGDLLPGARLPRSVLRAGDAARLPVAVELDRDQLPVALVAAGAGEGLRVVVVPEPVLEPEAPSHWHGTSISAVGEALRFALHPYRVGERVGGTG